MPHRLVIQSLHAGISDADSNVIRFVVDEGCAIPFASANHQWRCSCPRTDTDAAQTITEPLPRVASRKLVALAHTPTH